MADTDEASIAFAREAEQAKEKVQADIETLKPLLERLKYSEEGRLLLEFVSRFTEYRELDRHISTWLSKTRISRPSGSLSVLLRRQPILSVTPSGPLRLWSPPISGASKRWL